MPQISLTDFTDFVLRVGTTKITKVNEVKQRPPYDPKTDHWKRLRDLICSFHEGKCPSLTFEGTGASERKRTAYLEAIKGHKQFIKKNPGIWFKPHAAIWTYEGLDVRVNPELGWQIKGKKHLVKLYFKKDKLTPSRVKVLLALMGSGVKNAKFEVSILEVRTGCFYSGYDDSPIMQALLQGEAATFLAIWNSLIDT